MRLATFTYKVQIYLCSYNLFTFICYAQICIYASKSKASEMHKKALQQLAQ